VRKSRVRGSYKSKQQLAREKAQKEYNRIREKKRAGIKESDDDSDVVIVGPESWNRGDEAPNERVQDENDSITDVDLSQQDDLDVEDGFIDDSGIIEGEEEEHQIPLEFSSHSTKPAKELFVHVVEWMVHNKINPAFDRNNPIYRLAMDKMNNEAQGLAGQGTSSTWGPHEKGIKFTKALQARPKIIVEPYDNSFDNKYCDACNRSRHPASFAISFDGPVYDKNTLEPIDESTSSEDEEDDEEESEQTPSIPGPETTFYVGRSVAVLYPRYPIPFRPQTHPTNSPQRLQDGRRESAQRHTLALRRQRLNPRLPGQRRPSRRICPPGPQQHVAEEA
jgi:hypothetical protein